MSLSPFFALFLFAVADLCLLVALVVHPSPHRWLFILPITAIDLSIISASSTALFSDASLLYTFGCALAGLFFVATDYILLTDVQNELFMCDQRVPASSLPLNSRFQWAFNLHWNVRGVGWTHGLPRNAPKPPGLFVKSQLLRACAYLVATETLTSFNYKSPSLLVGGPPLSGPMAISIVLASAASFGMVHSIAAAFMVGVGMSRPEGWPPFFGSVLDSFTLRNFWGKCWHQLLRRMAAAHGKFLARRVFNLARGGKMSSLCQLYTAFLVSAIIHYCGDFMLLRNWSGGSLRFFLLQAVGIMVEDAVLQVIGPAVSGPRMTVLSRCVGYMWVIGWFMWTTPHWLNPLCSAGVIQATRPLSLLALIRG